MENGELTPQQRAARITLRLTQRALQKLPGLSTAEIAELCGLCEEAARVMMCNLSAQLPIHQTGGRWVMLTEQLTQN